MKIWALIWDTYFQLIKLYADLSAPLCVQATCIFDGRSMPNPIRVRDLQMQPALSVIVYMIMPRLVCSDTACTQIHCACLDALWPFWRWGPAYSSKHFLRLHLDLWVCKHFSRQCYCSATTPINITFVGPREWIMVQTAGIRTHKSDFLPRNPSN